MAYTGENTRAMVLRAIAELHEEKGIPPTRREVAEHIGKGRTTVQYHINILVERGALRREDGMARSVVVNGPTDPQEAG